MPKMRKKSQSSILGIIYFKSLIWKASRCRQLSLVPSSFSVTLMQWQASPAFLGVLSLNLQSNKIRSTSWAHDFVGSPDSRQQKLTSAPWKWQASRRREPPTYVGPMLKQMGCMLLQSWSSKGFCEDVEDRFFLCVAVAVAVAGWPWPGGRAGWPWPGGRGRVAVAGWPWPGVAVAGGGRGRVAVAGWPGMAWLGMAGCGAGWPGGRVAGWPGMAGWPVVAGWPGGREWPVGQLWLAGWLAG